MSAPTNISALTAIDLGVSLPVSVTQNVHDAGTTYTVWYAYTAQVTDVVLGLWGFGGAITGYLPRTQVYVGPASAPIAYLIDTGTDNSVPVQFPVTVGTTYYFKFTTSAGNPSPAVLTLHLQQGPSEVVPAGSLAVNDDTNGFPLVLLSSTTGAPLQFRTPFPNGEAGDVLTDGTSCVHDDTNNRFAIYSSALELVTTVSSSISSLGGALRTCQGSQRWWFTRIVTGTAHARSLTADGTLGADHVMTAIANVEACAASNDEAVLYHVASGANKAIRRWDLVNDVALTDLTAAVPNYLIFDILVLSDDSIVASYIKTSATIDVLVKRFDASGTLLNTYSLGAAHAFPGGTLPRLAYAREDPARFWVWTHPNGVNLGLSRFQSIVVATGFSAADVQDVEYEEGVYNRPLTTTPEARFGNSFSCPFWITRVAIQPPAPPFPDFLNGPEALAEFEATGFLKAFDVPRVRTAPHLADEGERLFYSKFQLDLEAGAGTVTGQGVDPVVLLRYSNDGGFTWSAWRQLSVGALGQYRWRCIAWRLGMARDRVFQVRQTDPVKSAWLTAYLDFDASEAS